MHDFNIVAMQEHWLFNFECNFLDDVCSDLSMDHISRSVDHISRSVDDKDPISLHQRPRGFGGVAFVWDRKLSHRISIIPDGNEHILTYIGEGQPQRYLYY